jgi:hypothetical protein
MTEEIIETGSERRGNSRLRGIFVEAYDVLQPFFDPANNWAGQTHEHLAYRSLHERFPDLTTQEVFTLVAAAKRVFSTSGKPVP